MKESMMAAAADGFHYAVPSTGFWETMFVNKAVLDACGIPVPGPDYTWEQFLLDCESIKQAGYTPIACSLYEIPHYWFEFTVMNNGSLENHLEVPTLDAEGKLRDEEVSRKWIAALEDMKLLLLRYLPMGGIILAFKDYKMNPRNPSFISNLITSKWVGFDNFKFLFKTDAAWVMLDELLPTYGADLLATIPQGIWDCAVTNGYDGMGNIRILPPTAAEGLTYWDDFAAYYNAAEALPAFLAKLGEAGMQALITAANEQMAAYLG